jgi:hypothetical protein
LGRVARVHDGGDRFCCEFVFELPRRRLQQQEQQHYPSFSFASKLQRRPFSPPLFF